MLCEQIFRFQCVPVAAAAHTSVNLRARQLCWACSMKPFYVIFCDVTAPYSMLIFAINLSVKKVIEEGYMNNVEQFHWN